MARVGRVFAMWVLQTQKVLPAARIDRHAFRIAAARLRLIVEETVVRPKQILRGCLVARSFGAQMPEICVANTAIRAATRVMVRVR
ncbi:MAG: hypothetical protein AAGI50_04100 [Pseudomonadota bacterium]